MPLMLQNDRSLPMQTIFVVETCQKKETKTELFEAVKRPV
jgi:hypothetical protein